jgi:hypothetical protein
MAELVAICAQGWLQFCLPARDYLPSAGCNEEHHLVLGMEDERRQREGGVGSTGRDRGGRVASSLRLLLHMVQVLQPVAAMCSTLVSLHLSRCVHVDLNRNLCRCEAQL